MSSLKWPLLDFLGRTIYREPEPPPRIRDPSKPMQVLCVGFPRTGTESIQVALHKLGYDHTYHGWDIIFEEPPYCQTWARLARRKLYGPHDGESNISRADFDAVLGHSMAVVDAIGVCFAAELIAAYPEAKVILNLRRDEDAWYKSVVANLCEYGDDPWSLWLLQWVVPRAFWAYMACPRLIWRIVFRASDEREGAMGRAIRRNARWIYREHNNMIRGLVPAEKLLEFDVRDGWGPLCKFLGKQVPDEAFPNTNNHAAFEAKSKSWERMVFRTAIMNVSIVVGVLVAGIGSVCWRLGYVGPFGA